MHLVALELGLALSLVERREGGRVINYWAGFRDLHKKVKDLATHIFGSKNKSVFEDYKTCCESKNVSVIRVNMTNKTRVAGIYHMFQDLLRSLFALKFYASINAPTRAKMLTDDEWNQVAQFTGLMDDPTSLCFISQKDCDLCTYITCV